MPRVVNQIILGSPLLDVASPGWLLSAAVPILLGILHHQPVKSLVKSVYFCINVGRVRTSRVSTVGLAVVKKSTPVRVLSKNVRIADDDHERLGAGDGNVEPLAALQKAELVLVISVDVLNLGANTGNDDHPSLLALELFSGPDGNLLELLATAVQLFPDLLNLPPVRRDDPDLFRGDLVPLEAKDLLDILDGDGDLLRIEETRASLFALINADDSMEDQGELAASLVG